MKLISLILLSSALAASAFFSGCAAGGKQSKKGPAAGESAFHETGDKPSRTQMKISYQNKSSKMSLLLDVNSQDMNLNMSGAPETTGESKFPWLDENKAQPQTQSQGQPKAEKPAGKEEESSEWNDVMDIAKGSSVTNKDIQAVLAEIRKAQEFFYQKRYAEALDMVKFSLQKQETAEGFALMGSILYMMENLPAAKDSWVQSLRLNPDMPAVTQMLEKIK